MAAVRAALAAAMAAWLLAAAAAAFAVAVLGAAVLGAALVPLALALAPLASAVFVEPASLPLAVFAAAPEGDAAALAAGAGAALGEATAAGAAAPGFTTATAGAAAVVEPPAEPDGALGAGIEVKRIIGGIVYPAAELLEPGVVKVIEGNRFTLGELDNQRSPRIEALSKSMMAAGFKAPVSRDIRSEIWVKLWGNLTFNPVSALSHATLEDICTYPLTRELAQRMMEEAQRVGEKLGVTFKVSVDQRIAGAQAVGAHKTSMLQDVEQGRALELEALLGSVVELARITDTPTPNLDAIYAVTSLLSHTLMQQGGKLALQRA